MYMVNMVQDSPLTKSFIVAKQWPDTEPLMSESFKLKIINCDAELQHLSDIQYE